MTTSAWFDYNAYMANKLVQVREAEPAANWDMLKLVKAFSDADFAGAAGAEEHFKLYGQYEDVAPNAFFNATEYYRAKAAAFYEYDDPKKVSDLDAASIQVAIKDSGMSAWSHYEQYGNTEKINPSNSFDTEAYMNAKLTALNANLAAGQDPYKIDDVYKSFQTAGVSALEHFMIYAGKGGDGEVTQGLVDGKIPAEFDVLEAKKVKPGGSGSGNTYALTTGVDTLVGSGSDDTFNAVLTDSESTTYSPGDTVDGNGGKDTFNLTASTNISSNLASIKGMTDVNLTIATSSAFTADMSDFAGVDTFNVKANAAAITISGVSKDAVVNVGNLKSQANIEFSDVSGADDTAIVGLTGFTTAAGATIAGVEKLTLQTVGADSVLGNVTIADTKTLTIAGHDDLTIGTLVANKMTTLVIENAEGFVSIKAGDATTANSLTKVDATKNDGGLFLDLTAQSTDAALSFTGGGGDDTLSMNYTYLKNTASIKGGDGTDTFVIGTALADSSSVTTALNKVVSDFEVLGINTSAANTITVSDFTNGITDFLLYGQATSSGTATFTNSLSSTKFEIDFSTANSTGYAKLEVTNKAFEAKSDLTIDNQLATTATVSAANFTGVDELNLHSIGNGGTNIVTALTIAEGKSLVIDGDVDLTITVANSLKVNAEAFEGDLELTTTTAKDMQIVGGKGDDTITAGSKASLEFDGIAGGNDTLIVTAAAVSSTGSISDVEMTTFKGADAGDVLTFGSTATFDKIAVDVSNTDVLLEALNLAAAGSGSASGGMIKYFTFGGDTYVVADMSSAASLSTTDVVVKLVGTDIDLSKAIYDTADGTLTFA